MSSPEWKRKRPPLTLLRHSFRGTHVKTQAVVKGTLTVLGNLPDHLKQGLFSQAGAHPFAMRFANEPSLLQDDKTPGPRGVGMRVFDVPGQHLDPIGDRTETQDFTFNSLSPLPYGYRSVLMARNRRAHT